MVRVFATSGPLIAAVGAALLAYGVYRGPVNWYVFVHFYRKRLEAEERMHQSIVSDYGSLPTPPYSEEEKKRLLDAEMQRYEERISREQESTEQEDLRERTHSFWLGVWGFVLVAVGSLLQTIGAFLA